MMLYRILDPGTNKYLSSEVIAPNGQRVIYWTDDPERAHIYKTGSGARRAAARVGGIAIDMEECEVHVSENQ